MKLKYFYRIDNNKNPVTASNVKRKSKPGKQWRELKNACCDPLDIPCSNCNWRYFVQLDANNNPVDHSLIKRKSKPEIGFNIRYMEVVPDSCCTLLGIGQWQFLNVSNDLASYSIKSNNILMVDSSLLADTTPPTVSATDLSAYAESRIVVNLANPSGTPSSGITVFKDNVSIHSEISSATSFEYAFNVDPGSVYVISLSIND